MAGRPNRPLETIKLPGEGASVRASSQRGLNFEIVDTLDRFEDLRSDWDALVANDGEPHHVFQQHSWLSYWCSHFYNSEQQSLAVVVGWRNGRLKFAWPLVRETRMGCTLASFMGAPVSQYCDVLIASDEDILEVLPQALNLLTSDLGCHLLMASRVREDAHILPAFEQSNARPCAQVEAPEIELSGLESVEDLTARLSASTRKSRKRRFKRLSEKGAVSLRTSEPGDGAGKLVHEALAFKEAWFAKNAIVSNAFTDPRFTAFWVDVASGRLGSCGLYASALDVGGRPAAIELGLRFMGVHFAHIGAFDLELEDCSPGQAHLDLIVGDCIEAGINSYDFLPPSSLFKDRLATRSTPVRDFVIPLSRLGSALDGARITQAPQLAKAVISKLPPSARSVVSSSVKKLRGYFSS